ncbi:MAG: thymidine kinase [Trueperaceae bacterium]|nr:thymidine kinase [Trueperaceae bacterium]
MLFYEFAPSGNLGWLELIVGPMFSGKSEELIRRVNRAVIAKQKVQVFKPALDDRYDAVAVASHNGRTVDALAVKDVSDIKKWLESSTQVIAIDEGQFLGDELIPLVLDLADAGRRVLIAGLDQDFRGEPFGPIPQLLAHAEFIDKLTAICKCGRPATRTQRLIAGHPAHYDDPIILVGASESYEPRCRSCHEVPKKARVSPLFNEAIPMPNLQAALKAIKE